LSPPVPARAPEAWLEAHSYLRPVAELCARVERATTAVAALEPRLAPAPRFEDYQADYLAGVPLLQSADAAVDLEAAGELTRSLVARLAAEPPDDSRAAFAADVRALDDALRREPDAARRISAWLLGDDAFSPPSPGLLLYLGWAAAAFHLRPLVSAFDAWRDEEKWLRRYCPTCGSSPSMAQLVGTDTGRKRLLSCGHCGTRWQFHRTTCPYCGTDNQRLASVALDGEPGLRIDYCESCRGYLKTYDGQGDEGTMLSDWTTLHLDVIAQDRGLKRLATSLYALDPGPSPEPAAAPRALGLPVLQ